MTEMLQGMVGDKAIVPKIDVFVNPAKSSPIQVGDVIFTDAPDAEMKQKIEFAPVIAFSEPGICEGQPILEVLHETVQLIDGVIGAFRPYLE